MVLLDWADLPNELKNAHVKKYYDYLYKKKYSLIAKRVFDLLVAVIISIVFMPVIVAIGLIIRLDSKGPVLFRQERVTQYGRKFTIYKFRTMIVNANLVGTQVTVKDDKRITKVGKILRKLRLDELPQLINIIIGDMTFVGTRPEVDKYVARYTDEMVSTLLMPAGITSEASIKYKDEEYLLANETNADEVYLNKILPEKMKYNLESLKEFSFFGDIKTMIKTVYAVAKRG
ncbi:sugar transferase [Paenibacillus silvisoli]|uniref:sugar transferase n=1 Tax=Paenibacillus silvisoli TaxID=3110539 RepID=UPI002804F306|nr:sugar transferase [Paenibacillus silvisoli]